MPPTEICSTPYDATHSRISSRKISKASAYFYIAAFHPFADVVKVGAPDMALTILIRTLRQDNARRSGALSGLHGLLINISSSLVSHESKRDEWHDA